LSFWQAKGMTKNAILLTNSNPTKINARIGMPGGNFDTVGKTILLKTRAIH
jgi:hypothetical protein